MDPLTLGLSLGGSLLQGFLGNRAASAQRRAAQQQLVADPFHQLGLIPKPVRISDALRAPKS